jgi:hypothetical protein
MNQASRVKVDYDIMSPNVTKDMNNSQSWNRHGQSNQKIGMSATREMMKSDKRSYTNSNFSAMKTTTSRRENSRPL